MKKYIVLISLLAGSIFSSLSSAQFAGDVFFDTPSVAVPQNEIVDLSLSAFLGATVFGAAQVSLTYDPQKLEIVSVTAGTAQEIQSGFSYKLSPGQLGIIALNSVSLSKPIGTINLAKIKVRSLAPVGSYTYISTQVQSMLRQDSSGFSSPDGFSAEILTTASSANTTALKVNSQSLKLSAQTDEELKIRARQLRPEGSLVKLKVLNNSIVSDSTVKTGNNANEEVIEN
jgi:hypothetical protein